jgi:DNA-directed RNA polymerase delta subunit
MKTAMQELRWLVSDGLDSYDEGISVSQIWAKINDLLEKEKQQIKDAFKQGYSDCNTDQDCLPTKYYNDTFKP